MSKANSVDTQRALASFSPPIRAWFEETFEQATPPQAQGWPAIQRGDHTLILAPTGSGKTLAAFLWGIDEIYRELSAAQAEEAGGREAVPLPGVRLIYISPLKALNNDIHRNLRLPLAGIRRKAHELALDFPPLEVAVRSGDTPQRERQAMLRRPPHILITTPESFYLLLTSPKARDMFQTVRTVIVDEIHTLAGNKRGVHLALSLERLEALAEQPIQRIGLSATIRPLEEVARFLGGAVVQRGRGAGEQGGGGARSGERGAGSGSVLVGEQGGRGAEEQGSGGAESRERGTESGKRGAGSDGSESEARGARSGGLVSGSGIGGERVLVPRGVTVVDAGYEKPLDLGVETLVDDFRNLPGDSVWPIIIARVAALIREHQTTLIFTNDRRSAERAADRLNEQFAAEAEGKASGLIEGGVVKGSGLMGAGTGRHTGPVRVHHGSVSKEVRLALERDLKEGRLPALVGTSSLELGIDIGSVDLVVQLQSPKSVAQGLQRVGRSGHLVGQTSKGRIFPTHREDMMEAAAIAGGMLAGAVEPTYTPRNSLDVLAQQIVAMVSVETWEVESLFELVRRAYPYHDLTPKAFRAVLEMLSGRYPHQAHRELRARLAWDQVNDKLMALPGSRMLALTNGGTIPDRGAFSAYLSDGKTELGELDEEFVYETRLGDTLILGSQVWRVIDLDDDKVIVAEAPGATPRMPFWRGDFPWRPYELGRRVGAFRRAVAERLQQVRVTLKLQEFWLISENRNAPAIQAALTWLREHYALDERSAWQILTYVAGQLDKAGAISSDRTVIVELFDDPLGDPRMVIHSPFGGRVNGPWGLALAGALRERMQVNVEVQTNDDGILLRFPDADPAGEAAFPLDLVTEMGPAEARERILAELPDSAVFGAQFRQNAARALLLPGLRRGKRTPFWLQRLRAKDLLQVVRQLDDFPIVAETYRDCLEDVMDLPHLEAVLTAIQQGKIQVVPLESLTPSPVAQSLLWDFVSIYMYEWDAPKAERQLQTLAMNRDLLQDLLKDVALDELLRPEAVAEVRQRLQHTAPAMQARTVEELAILFQQLGDLSSTEVAERTTVDPADWIAQLAGDRRIVALTLPTAHGSIQRWVAAEYAPEYRAAFGLATDAAATFDPAEARRRILERFLDYAGPVTRTDILARYAFPADWLETELDQLVESRHVAHGRFTPQEGRSDDASAATAEFIDRRTLEQVHRRTLTLLRREVRPVPYPTYADFLARWQHLHPADRLAGSGALTLILQQLRAVPVVGPVWERDVLPLRLADYDPTELEALCQSGELVWVGSGGVDPRRGRIRFLFRGEGNVYLEPAPDDLSGLSEQAQAIYDFLKSEGAVFFNDICAGLDLAAPAVEMALIELVMAGLVTNDSLAAMRQIVREGSAVLASQRREVRPFSSLEEQLAERRGRRGRLVGGPQKPSRARYEAAKRRVQQRLGSDSPAGSPQWVGRWTPVHRFGVLGKTLPPEEQVARQTRQLLARYGVLTRASLAGEIGRWDWSLIYPQLQRLEMRGEVRRGYFVQGLPGVQFALPEAVERLRAARDGDQAHDEAFVIMNACDPANLYGPALAEVWSTQPDTMPRTADGQPLTFSRIPSTWLVQQRGWPVLLAEDTGGSLTPMQGADESLIRQALHDLFDHLSYFERRVTIKTWNGEPVLDSAGRFLLESTGAYRDYPGMTWEKRA